MTSAGRELNARARRGLLDALDALGPHARGVVLVGAQAIHLRTGDTALGIRTAPFTSDADLLLDTRLVSGEPPVETVLSQAGFSQQLTGEGTVDPASGGPRTLGRGRSRWTCWWPPAS